MLRSRRITRLATAVAAIVLASGCAVTQDGTKVAPISPRERALERLERQANYEGYWRAAQACAELADAGTEGRERFEREGFAKRGMEDAEKAIALQPDAVEGHYYRAICIGRYLEAERLPTFSLVSVLRDEGVRAAEIDPRFECSGANRLLGQLLSEAPEWGPGGVGDKEEAEKRFLQSLQFAPACPENHLAYAKFRSAMDDADKARDEVEKARALIDAHEGIGPGEKQRLRERCDELAKELSEK